jgi:hypothetical protein
MREQRQYAKGYVGGCGSFQFREAYEQDDVRSIAARSERAAVKAERVEGSNAAAIKFIFAQ